MSNVVALLVPVVLLSIVAATLTALASNIRATRQRVLRDALGRLFFDSRCDVIGEDISANALRGYCRGDARRALASARPDASWFRRSFFVAPLVLQRNDLAGAIRTLFPDLAPSAAAIVNRLGDVGRQLRAHYFRRLAFTAVLGSAAVSFLYTRRPELLGTAPGEAPGESLLRLLVPAGRHAASAGSIASAMLTTALVAFVTLLLVGMISRRSTFLAGARLDEAPPADTEDKVRIGRDHCAVRVINFAGGGFDSIMQLGVIHALMVIQGRPPDAVVGLSTGAIPAVALAEVLQAGEEFEPAFAHVPWGKLPGNEQLRLQMLRAQARVHRFRRFENAAYQARQRLFDVLTPDAYQVESNDPLAPLETPFFQSAEREQKLNSLKTKSGLVRLYNDILGLHIAFGTLVRALRRVLGFLAATEVPTLFARVALRVLEFTRIWLLVGSNLRGVSRLLPLLVKPVLPRTHRVRPLSAGSLIFRFPINHRIVPPLVHGAAFFLLLVFWLAGSLLPLFFPALLWFWIGSDPDTGFRIAWWTVILYVFIAMFALVATAKVDATNVRDAWRDNQRGIAQFAWLTLKLLAVLVAVAVGLAVLIEAGKASTAGAPGDPSVLVDVESLRDRVAQVVFVLLAIGTSLFVAVAFAVFGSIYYSKFRAWLRGAREPHSYSRSYLQRFLASYHLDRSLLDTYDLRKFLIELFDRDYYGATDIDDVVRDSLMNRKNRSAQRGANPKKTADYRSDDRAEKIHVGIAAANVLQGELETIPDSQNVIDSIEAAMAIVPLYPAKTLGGSVYVNGTNVANVPTRATSSFLRNRINEKSGTVHLYSVSPFPLSRRGLEDREFGREPYVHLWDIVKRAISLQRHRDAKLEQALTEYYTMVIPAHGKDATFRNQLLVQRGDDPTRFARIWVTPIETERPLGANSRILFAPAERQREVVAETIADGCRAALEMMIRPSIDAQQGSAGKRISCGRAVLRHLRDQAASADLNFDPSDWTLPGSDSAFGPGLREICERCALNRDAKAVADRYQGYLRLKDKPEEKRPAWPHERATTDGDPEDDSSVCDGIEERDRRRQQQFGNLGNWPADRGIRKGDKRPTLTLLFSGGVFRGVFQMGVLNALNEMRIRPDLVAGASIGTITAAMVARVFSINASDEDAAQLARRHQVARLSSVYMAVDRLILTDRFADFVRNLTIRASRIGFSMRDADHFFRKYDHPRTGQFDRLARNVLAGLERLFYVNPYQLNELVKAIRNNQENGFTGYLREYTQQWLRRMDVGVEMLGAEPLQTLIEAFVIPDRFSSDAARAPLSDFNDADMRLLATATNLQRGKLEIIGEPRADGSVDEALLMEALLVSSAFPGIFRPRWSWDLRPGSIEKAQFIDGGVLDNLPVEPVFDFLSGALAADRIAPRPVLDDGSPAPHLVVAASLEADAQALRFRDQWEPLKDYWPRLLGRTKELKYNSKTDIYCSAQRNFRAIHAQVCKEFGAWEAAGALVEPIDVEVVTVKPKWLCSTFGFHPMLGFRQEKQARSIAHGCAATLVRFASVERNYLEGWQIGGEDLPKATSFPEARTHWESLKSRRPGACWLRPDKTCPFSKAHLEVQNQHLPEGQKPLDRHTINELARIHRFCKEPKTHRRE